MNVLFIIIPIMAVLLIVLAIVFMFSPKLRGKMLSKQVESMRYMLDESKMDIAKLGSTSVNLKKQILDENEETLTDIAKKEANIKSVGIKSAAKAVKEGLTESDTMYCKHCGSEIDSDSKYCKKCGKEQ